jgi:hypothetical protein
MDTDQIIHVAHPDNHEYAVWSYWEKEDELWKKETRPELQEARSNYFKWCEYIEKKYDPIRTR